MSVRVLISTVSNLFSRECDLCDETIVGRGEDCDVVVPDTAVSGRHLMIQPDGDGIFFQDLGSTNGTAIDGSSAASGFCAPGSELEIGNTTIRIVKPESSEVSELIQDREAALTVLASRVAGDSTDLSGVFERALYGVSLLLTKEQDFESFCNSCLEILADEMEFLSAAMILRWDDPADPRMAASIDRGGRPVISRSIIHRIVSQKAAFLLSSGGGPGTEPPESSASIIASGIQSFLVAPVLFRGESCGLLQIEAPALPFTEYDLKGIAAIAGIIGAVKESSAAKQASRAVEREKAILARYLSHDVVNRVLSGGDSLRLGGDARKVTVFFSDIRGYTALSEELSPEDLVRLLNRFFERIAQQIFEFDGTIDKFIGDAVMAVFGAPFPAKDDALRACRMALAVRDIVKAVAEEVRAETGLEVGMGFGLSSGKVISGNIGWAHRLEYTSIGDPVNLASRLTGEASAGEILADLATVELAGILDVRERGRVPIKGKRDPVDVFEIVGVKEQ